jgi:hypothetical protein
MTAGATIVREVLGNVLLGDPLALRRVSVYQKLRCSCAAVENVTLTVNLKQGVIIREVSIGCMLI